MIRTGFGVGLCSRKEDLVFRDGLGQGGPVVLLKARHDVDVDMIVLLYSIIISRMKMKDNEKCKEYLYQSGRPV